MNALKKKIKKVKKTDNKGIKIFIKELASHPTTVGAAWPSSKHLADGIAKIVPHITDGIVVELGAGTGVITQALLKKGVPTNKLFVVEKSTAMSEYLHKNFPKIKVLQGDAQKLTQLLGAKHKPVKAIVSSLPLRSLPNKTIKEIGKELEKILDHDSLFIQFTYSLHRKPKAPSSQLKWQKSKYIWRNLPPARIDIFSYEGE